jgi:RHS repeat-associated protein
MAMKKRFYSVNGLMMGYEEGGVKKDFLTDHLGSITAEVDQTQTRTYESRYSAYGRNLWSTGTGCGFGWVGSYGYRETGTFFNSHYVRARHYSYITGNWSTVDPLWPDESAYGYVDGSTTSSVDPSGRNGRVQLGRSELDRAKCDLCAFQMKQFWFNTFAHHCNHQYTHCMACCVLTGLTNNPECARGAQYAENVYDYPKKRGIPNKEIWRERDKWCAAGISVARGGFRQFLDKGSPAIILPGWHGACSASCSAIYPDPKPDTPECADHKRKHPEWPAKLPPIPQCEPDFWKGLEDPYGRGCS